MLLRRGNGILFTSQGSPSSSLGLLVIYRYASLALSSIFFLLDRTAALEFKVGVIATICIAAWIITDLQKRYIGNKRLLTMIVIAEMVGVTLLLIPTGGISSAFIWYALNPVLVASVFLSSFFCWGILAFFFGSATFIAYSLFDSGDLSTIFLEKSYFYLVCLLTVVLTRLFSGLTKKLLNLNGKLTETNKKYEDTLEQVMSHYHLVDSFSTSKSPQLIIEEITHSLKKCTQSDAAFFWLTDLSRQNSHIAATCASEVLEAELKMKWNAVRGKKEPFVGRLNDAPYGMKIVRTSNNVGILGVKINSSREAGKSFLQNRPFEFLSELSEMMLERLHMDQMMDQMIVIEEQNRIANEIHDSVSQRLFGIVCSLHSLQVKGRHMTDAELNQEYQFLSQSANTTIKELRSAIFRLSSTKKGDTPFLVRLKKYLDEYAKLNDIRIDYQITGDEAFIPDKVKQALYRIICEACGNSVRHGECHRIELSLGFDSDKIALRIQDDGIGFAEQTNEGKEEKGLGLINIKSLVHSFAGTFSINGIREAGTIVEVDIPIMNTITLEKVVGE